MPKTTQCGFAPGGLLPAHHMLVVQGPTLVVDIGFDPAFTATSVGVPNLAQRGVPALVDTGAHESFIDNDLAISLKLPVVDRQKVSGSNGQHEVSVYLAHIHVPSLVVTQLGRFGGVHLAAGGQRHSALIGRTFLMHFKMIYDGRTGVVELTLP